MLEVKYVSGSDRSFWFSLDRHLPEEEFESKVSLKQGYVLFFDGKPVGLLRYNMFWDSIPFCTMLFIDDGHRGIGCGRRLLEHWENDMKARGYKMILTSTRADEEAQHFYRKLGYRDCGSMVIDIPGYAQPTELFLIKAI